MIRVFYDGDTGRIAYTVETHTEEEQPNSLLPFLDVDALPAGDLHAGYMVSGGAIVPATDLTDMKTLAKENIDAQAENVRLMFVTPGSAQAMTYEEKYNEAVAYQANPSISESLIPHIVAEVGITGPDKQTVAQVIIDTRNQWQALSAQIERLRLGAKKAVDDAASMSEIDSAKTIDWSSIGA